MGISMLAGAGISGAASLFGASQSASASKKAAMIQAQTAQAAMAQQQAQFQQTQNNLKPYLDLGSQGAAALGNRLTDLTTGVPFNAPDISDPTNRTALAPGYDFTLSQGLKATQNSQAARGLGLSGAAIKAAGTYATGLANQTYGDVFNRAQQGWQDQVTNQTNNYNRLVGVAGMGASTATGQGQIGTQTANSISNSLMAAGNAEAAGINGSAAAWTSGINGVANAANAGVTGYNQNQLLQALAAGGGLTKNGSSIDLSQYGLGNKLLGLYGS